MIVEMSKITLLMLKNSVDKGLTELRKLGLVHVENIISPSSEDISFIEEQIQGVEKAINVLGSYSCQRSDPRGDQIAFHVKEVINIQEEQIELTRRKEEIANLLRWYDVWGMVSLKKVKELESAGYLLRLYRAPKAFLKTVSDEDDVFVIGEDKTDVRLLLITKDPEQRLDLKEEPFPEIECSELKEEQRKVNKDLDVIEENLSKLAKYRERFEEYKNELSKKLEFAKVKSGMGDEDQIVYVQGYAPIESVEKIIELADKSGWGLISSEPEEIDQPPTLIRPKKWESIILPLFKFMGVVPGYREYDISGIFLVFFSFFYAMLIGDAGYGLVFLLLTFIARKKMKTAPNEPFILMYVLSVATLIWGAITGSWFGSQQAINNPIISTMAFFRQEASSEEYMMKFCFTLGAIHLTLAHLIVIAREKLSKKGIAQIGWILCVWGLYCLANTLVLGDFFPVYAKILLLVGGILIFAGAGSGTEMVSIPLDIISGFSDVVSYLRLYAVGYASLMVAQTFNEMGTGLIGPLILFGGHALNILLGMMAIIVHGVRLNMLEFSGHVGLEWAGREYEPFKE